MPNAPCDVTLESADGNHVVLDLGGGRYAFYAHLEAGSVAVRAGERVRRGQPFGELGNSGSSTGPHLHFHVMDAPSPLAADGLPYAFDRFDLAGRRPPLDEVLGLGEAAGGDKPIAVVQHGLSGTKGKLPPHCLRDRCACRRHALFWAPPTALQVHRSGYTQDAAVFTMPATIAMRERRTRITG